VRVNKVTPQLFKKYRTIADFANANPAELENEIRSTGFFRSKTKNIIACFQKIAADHNGKIPADIETLVTLPGGGRKTASVFLAEYHKIPALAVDTHVARTARRLGLTNSKNPAIIERDLCKLFNRENWCKYHLYLVLFGRYHCKAQRPQCEECGLRSVCKT
jgi:endonuclease-3